MKSSSSRRGGNRTWLMSLPPTVSRKPILPAQQVELQLPLWVSADRLAEGRGLVDDIGNLTCALRLARLFLDAGMPVSMRSDVASGALLAAIRALPRLVPGQTDLQLPAALTVPFLQLFDTLLATAPAVLVTHAFQTLSAMPLREAALDSSEAGQ